MVTLPGPPFTDEPRWQMLQEPTLSPGAPEYRAHMKAAEGTQWRSVEHHAHAEYQTLMKDIVLESEFLGDPSAVTR